MKKYYYKCSKFIFLLIFISFLNVNAEFRPNGGENGEFWKQNTTQKIVWDTSYFHGYINIFLWDMISAKFTVIALNIQAIQGEYNWQIPIDHPTGEYFRVKVQQADSSKIYQMSETFFPIYKEQINNVTFDEITNDDNFIIIPNPTKNKIIIRFKNEFLNSSGVQIFNSYGQKIPSLNHSLRQGTNQIEVDISTMTNGVYFAVITSNGKVYSKPFVVIR